MAENGGGGNGRRRREKCDEIPLFPNPISPFFRRPQTSPLIPFTKLRIRYPDGKMGEIESICGRPKIGVPRRLAPGAREPLLVPAGLRGHRGHPSACDNLASLLVPHLGLELRTSWLGDIQQSGVPDSTSPFLPHRGVHRPPFLVHAETITSDRDGGWAGMH